MFAMLVGDGIGEFYGGWAFEMHARRLAARRNMGLTAAQWQRANSAMRAAQRLQDRLSIRGRVDRPKRDGRFMFGRWAPICGPLGVLP